MLNILWPIFIILSYIYGIINGNVQDINNSIFTATSDAVQLAITLLGTMTLWSGLMNIVSNTSLIKNFTKFLQPFIGFLFPDVKKDTKINENISMNIIANILGLGNAATPLGLKAMESMQEKNESKDTVSNSMAMFIILNTASLQLIPTTVIAIRSSLGSENPTQIIFFVWFATIIAAAAGIIATKLLMKRF